MSEKIFTLDFIDPIDFFGVNNQHIQIISHFLPKLKIVARDNTIKVIGDDKEIQIFEDNYNLLIRFYNNKGYINASIIQQFFTPELDNPDSEKEASNEIILYGQNGNIIKALTPNQRLMVDCCNDNDLIFAIGPAGSGKTYTAVALAVKALREKKIKRIVLTRPAVEAGENLGFLPGDLKDKLDPYLQPLYDALWDMLPAQKLTTYLDERIIEIAPLAFMRGRTLDNAYVILDEAQNATINQMKMFLTRMGRSAKFFVTGDITQIDLPKNQQSGLVHALDILKNINGIKIIYFDNNDIIRHKLVKEIINAYNRD